MVHCHLTTDPDNHTYHRTPSGHDGMTAQTTAPPIVLDLADAPSVRIALATSVPVRRVRRLLQLARALSDATGLDTRSAVLQLADTYGRAAESGRYSDVVRASMLAAEQRARRLAEHLT